MVFAYIRVSTTTQDVQNQKFVILEFCNREGLKIDQWLEISVSSRKSTKERRIDELLETVNPGDCIIVSELSRLGRSVGQIAIMVAELNQKGVSLICLKEGIRSDRNGYDMTSKVQITMFSLLAEIERDLISMRTKEALAARKASGMKLGRPEGKGKSKLDQYKEEILALLANGSTKVWIAKRYGTTPGNLSHWLKRIKEESGGEHETNRN
jgi:DNA invertase Pin-like site-specific DNA recombinase